MHGETIALPGTGTMTTRVGFGCAHIVPETTNLLDAAYDAGIRHFDVARSYGRGLTESYLGEFLKRRGAHVTVTTKYGITAPIRNRAAGAARTLLRPLVRKLRRFRAMDEQITRSVGAMYQKAAFSPADARASLETSLRQLRRERVELFLMHEATADDLTDEGLLRFLEDEVGRGTIGAFGVGGDRTHVPDVVAKRPAFSRVLQHGWSAFEPVISRPGTFTIVYGIFGQHTARLRRKLDEDNALRRRWSDEIGADLAAPQMLERLVFSAAAARRPEDLILFSSTKVENIAANLAAARDPSLVAPGTRLIELGESAGEA